jgi:hypothetical protein
MVAHLNDVSRGVRPYDEVTEQIVEMSEQMTAALACRNRGVRVAANTVVEHAIQMSGGGMHVRCDDPEVEEVYPLERWIPNQQRFGGKVWRRTVIVVEDWTEVPPS